MSESDGNFYNTGSFQIGKRIDDPIIWTERSIEALCVALITSSGSEREYFFKKIFRGGEGASFPRYFLGPKGAFDPADKLKDSLFGIELYNGDGGEDLRLFITKLIEKDVLIKHQFHLLKCGCGAITLGANIYCNGCGKKLKSEQQRFIYKLAPTVADLFFARGKIIEGVVFHAIKHLDEKGLRVGMNCYFRDGEAARPHEIDVAITNTAKDKLLIAHITTAPQGDGVKQLSMTLKHGIKTLFISTETMESPKFRGILDATALYETKPKLFCNIATDPAFPGNVVKEIEQYFL